MMKRLATILIVFALAGASPAMAFDWNNRLPRLIEEGVAAYDSGDYETARGIFHDARVEAPDAPEPVMNLGLTSAKMGEYQEAIASFNHAVELAESAPEIRAKSLYNKGLSQFELARQALEAQDREQAIQMGVAALKSFNEALDAQSDFPDAEFNREQVRNFLMQLAQQAQQEQQQQQGDGDQNQDQQDQENQDQQNQQQQQQNGDQNQDQQDQQQSDQQQQQGDQQDQQNQQQGDQQNDQQQQQGEQQDQDQQQEGKAQQNSQEQGEEQQQDEKQADSGTPQEEQQPEEKQADQSQAGDQEQPQEGQQQQAQMAQQMSEEEAKNMLNLLGNRGLLILRQPRDDSRRSRQDW
ncbi:hypothetical protein KQI84_04380 [bacterium]|nr:hypothetical protein [bacterium]